VDTVVTRCRRRENDKKYVNGSDVRRRKHTAVRRRCETDKKVCRFFFNIYIGAACAGTSPFSIFFLLFFFGAAWLAVFPRPLFLNFFELKQIGPGPVLAPRTRRCWGEVRGAWPLPRRGREALEGRRSLSLSASGRALIFFLTRSIDPLRTETACSIPIVTALVKGFLALFFCEY
jgi:hypothetical protein